MSELSFKSFHQFCDELFHEMNVCLIKFLYSVYSAPAAKRCLELILDVQGSEIVAIEKENLPVLNRGIEKGMKLKLIPPLKMSKNVLLLKKRNIQYLSAGNGENAATERLEERLRENGGVPPSRKRKCAGALSSIVSENIKSKPKSKTSTTIAMVPKINPFCKHNFEFFINIFGIII